ncbi:MAG TPA: UDP-N-acetylglucosamine 2-epimerase [Myxococcota bacterium]|jgi:UDP-hydrolysing UDP-N-acetyl-D-glucosamine 2-epimerase
MKPRKVCVVITARPSYARIRSVLEAIQRHPELELQLVVAASALLDRYGNAQNVIESEGFRIDRRVYMILEGENLVTSAKSTGLGMSEMATVLDDLKPDLVVTVADRFETIATAVAAAYLNIPLVHIQGGEVTGSIDEKVRHAVTKLADLHMVATERAAERVVRMGERPDRVFNTGCPSIDVARRALERPEVDLHEIFERFGGVGHRPELSGGFVVVLQHPVTTEYEASRRHVEETLHAIAESGIPAFWFWPNVDAGSDGTSKGIRAFRENRALPQVHFFKNLPPEDFIRVLNRSRGVVGNSSVGIRECSYLGVPTVNIGGRQEGRDRGRNVIDVPYDRKEIRSAIERCMSIGKFSSDLLYGDGYSGERIASLLVDAPLEIEKRLQY